MEEVITNTVVAATKVSWFSKLPKWLKIILLTLSIVTVVYWLGFVIYKILEAVRIIFAYIFEKRNYWTFLICVLILIVGSLLIAQFYFNLDPFGKMANWFIAKWNELREWLSNIIGG